MQNCHGYQVQQVVTQIEFLLTQLMLSYALNFKRNLNIILLLIWIVIQCLKIIHLSIFFYFYF